MTNRWANLTERLANAQIRGDNLGNRMMNARARAMQVEITGPVKETRFEALLTDMEQALTEAEHKATAIEVELKAVGV